MGIPGGRGRRAQRPKNVKESEAKLELLEWWWDLPWGGGGGGMDIFKDYTINIDVSAYFYQNQDNNYH